MRSGPNCGKCPIRRIKNFTMSNPVLVEVVRGALVESRHAGAVAVADGAGRLVFAAGRRGAAGLSALGDQGAAGATAGRIRRRRPLRAWRRGTGAGLRVAQRRARPCGDRDEHADARRPRSRARSNAARTGRSTSRRRRRWRDPAAQASALHNNCSGKHGGFLCAACAMGADTGSYVEAAHPVQREVKAALESLTGAALSQDVCAVDGCSVPTWAVPLGALARGFARFGTGEGLPPERAKAAARLRAACAQHPWHVAGTGRFCTEMMRRVRRARVRQDRRRGRRLRGAARAGTGHRGEMRRRRRPRRRGHAGGGDRALSQLRRRPCRAGALSCGRRMRNWNGIEVGSLRPTAAIEL